MIRSHCIPALIVSLAVLAGCASGVQRSEDASTSTPYFKTTGKQAQAVTLSLTRDVQTRLAGNLTFDQNYLLRSVKQGLEAKNLLAKAPDGSLPSIEITVTNVRVRSAVSAIMFGAMAGGDRLAGDVVVKDSGGRELQRFSVSATYTLGGFGGGQDSARMGWLYEKFVEHTIAELTGEQKKD